VVFRKQFLSADKRAKERKLAQMQGRGEGKRRACYRPRPHWNPCSVCVSTGSWIMSKMGSASSALAIRVPASGSPSRQ
jgi:hypothetical protein